MQNLQCGLLLRMFRGLCVSVCVSIGYNHELYKTAQPIEMPFGVWTRVGPQNHVLWGQVPQWEGTIFATWNV